MIQSRHQTLSVTQLCVDVIASVLALVAAWWLRFDLELIPVTKGEQDLEVYTRLLPLVILIFPLAFSIQGLYRHRPARGRAEELAGVLVGTVFGIVILSGVLLWFRPVDPSVPYSRATLALFAGCEWAFVSVGRLVVRRIVEALHRRGRDLDRVVIAGGGELAAQVAQRIMSRTELGFRVIGYVADRETNHPHMASLPRLGSLSDTAAVVAQHGAHRIFVALPHASAQETMALLDQLVREVVSVHLVPDLLQFTVLRSRVSDIDGLPTINLSETPLAGWSAVVKRLLDVLLSGVALVVLSPLLALIALLIWLEDRGPVFYRQVRMGLDAVPFEILKFRSMRVSAEDQVGAVWAERDDPRRTRVGAFLRAWSLDELPQLWNVLCGDMSLVGPRPERPTFVQQFRQQYPHYMLRHKVRAGMTGWAQVHGWRGNTSIHMRIEHDLYYIENWSLLLDVKILFMTIRRGLRHENAY